jgi:hypothetical protein
MTFLFGAEHVQHYRARRDMSVCIPVVALERE